MPVLEKGPFLLEIIDTLSIPHQFLGSQDAMNSQRMRLDIKYDFWVWTTKKYALFKSC